VAAANREFPKRFDFREAEPRIYQRWLDAGAFRSAHDSQGRRVDPGRADARPFAIVIPPPNITGRLHMGHALNNTIQDVLIRYKRMDGHDTLWVPGTDHAGIATQTVVKKQLDAQGIDYRKLGREETVRRIWQWREQYGDQILMQLRRMGCSCDWTRTRFTMDDGLSRAVREAFVRLYREGLIHRGKRIVNWCPVDRTALSDDEVEKEDEPGKMYDIRYPFADDEREHLVVSTTRPETLFGDVAVAVNPDDERYRRHVGRAVRLPLQGRIIPVIADSHADPALGTGCVKITPAHDPDDFEVGQRHGLAAISVMNEDATMNEVVPERYRGLDRYGCRARALEDLEAQGLLQAVRDHVLAIGRSYRSRVPIEFRLSDQWFVSMRPLAEKALAASGHVQRGAAWVPGGPPPRLRLHPERFEKVYLHWLTNIRDWCISRQIWWGHRIPAWYHLTTGEILVDTGTPERVAAEPDRWRQDEDVLDTWFSSWLWPMSVLGWPDRTPDYERYYPTQVLSTAKDILFFWVARMNFAGLHFDGRLPYSDVYLHSTITDEQGVTMSKSRGNGIDPLTLIDGATVEQLKAPVLEARPSNMKELLRQIERRFPAGFTAVGADAMRWTLIHSITEGERVRLSLERFTDGRNFITKLWNGAGRVIQALEQEPELDGRTIAVAAETDGDRWLQARLDSTIRACRSGLDGFDFGAVAQQLYRFVWDDYCSWALELSKTRLTGQDPAARRCALRVLGSVLADVLRLLHPIVPFVTEELWSRLRPATDRLGLWLDGAPTQELLVLDRYPTPRREPQPEIEDRFDIVQRLVVAVRQLRATSHIDHGLRITIQVKPLHPETRPMLERLHDAVCFLARLDGIQFVGERSRGAVAQYDSAFELFIDLGRYVDLREELGRLDKEIGRLQQDLSQARAKLDNAGFVERAPAATVAEVRGRAGEAEVRLAKLQATRRELAELAG
jgi:valyl-tRNA synthetase